MHHNYPEPVLYHIRFILVKQIDITINFTRIRKFLIVDVFYTKGEDKPRKAIG